jgi:hypothetical protein
MRVVTEMFGQDAVVPRGDSFVVGTGVLVHSPLRTRLHRDLSMGAITEVPGYERSLSRCRCRGDVFRAGWTINQNQSYGYGARLGSSPGETVNPRCPSGPAVASKREMSNASR